MKRTILTFATIIAFTAGSTLLTSCGSNTSSEDESTEQHDMNSDEGEHNDTMAEATHVCPMHPEITGLEGDTCSKCGMDLVAVADADSEMEHSDMATTHACPMHPEITGLEGDTCSKCGMDLTLADAGEEDHQD